MKKMATAAWLVAVSATAFAADTRHTCAVDDCQPGSRVIIAGSKADPAVICPTDGLSAFANFTLGLRATRAQFGIAPASDPDAMLASQEGETAIYIRYLKAKSGVASAREALAACGGISHRVKSVVIEVDRDSMQDKVLPDGSDMPVWIMSGYLEKP